MARKVLNTFFTLEKRASEKKNTHLLKGSRMGPFSGDFQRGGDSERNIPYLSELYRPYTACIIARLLYGSQQY